MNYFRRLFASGVFIAVFFSLSTLAATVTEADLPGRSLYLHIKGYAAPFPGPGDYTIDFSATGHNYSIKADGAIFAASGTWTFRQGAEFESVVLTLANYFGNGTGADIVLLRSAYYELYAGSSNQNGNWSLDGFVHDPIFAEPLADQIAPETGFVTFVPSLLNSSTGVTYQWFKDGIAITNATKSSFSIIGLTKADEGLYSVRVAQGSDTNVSRSARLTVVPPKIAAFAGHTFDTILTNNTPPPGLPGAGTTNAFRLSADQPIYLTDGQVTFYGTYSGTGQNRNTSGFGIFTLTGGVLQKLILNTDLMPGPQTPYLGLGGFSEPKDGQFLFYGVTRNSSSVNEYAILQWTGSNVTSRLASGTAIPGNESSTFRFFGPPGGIGLDAAFPGIGPGTDAGYYEFRNNAVVELFDNNSVLPGFAQPPLNYAMSIQPAGTSARRIFLLQERSSGLFKLIARNADGAIEKFLESGALYPGTTQPMTQYSGTPPKVRDGVIVASFSNESAANFLVSCDAQGVHPIAKTGDLLPGGVGEITQIAGYVQTDFGIAFGARTKTRSGVYLFQNGTISVIADGLSQVGTNIVTSATLLTGDASHVVMSVSLFPTGRSGMMINTGPAPVVPIRILSCRFGFDSQKQFTLTASKPETTAVILDHSSDLKTWEPLWTNSVTAAEVTIIDPRGARVEPQDFYRLRAQP